MRSVRAEDRGSRLREVHAAGRSCARCDREACEETAYGHCLCERRERRVERVPIAPMKQLHITTGSRCIAM